MTSLFVLGDSISINYGPYLSALLPDGWHYARKTAIPGTTFALSENGKDSDTCRQYLEYRFAQGGFAPDVLLLNCGLHDIKRDPVTDKRQVSAEDYSENLRVMRDLLHAKGIRLIWVNTTPVDDAHHARHSAEFVRRNADVIAVNTAAAAIFDAHSIPTIDLYGFTSHLTAIEQPLYGDHVHFTEAVCRMQAAYIAGALVSLHEERYGHVDISN